MVGESWQTMELPGSPISSSFRRVIMFRYGVYLAAASLGLTAATTGAQAQQDKIRVIPITFGIIF